MRINATRLSILAVFLILWEVVAQLGLVHPLLLAPFSEVIASIWKILILDVLPTWPLINFYYHFGITLIEIITGYAFAIAIGLSMGFIISTRKIFGDVSEPLIIAFYSIPTIALYPLFYLIFGFGPNSKIAYATMVAFFPIVTNTVAGIRQIDKSFIKVARSFGARTRELAFKVIIPAAAPLILRGLQLGLALSLIAVIAGELIASSAGLGYLIGWTAETFRTPYLFALIVIIITLAFVINHSFSILGKRWRKW